MRLRLILFTLVFFAGLFLIGSLGLGLMKKKSSIFGALTWGFVFALAIFQVIAYPLYRLQASFQLLFWLYTSVIACISLYAIWRLVARKELPAYADSAMRFFRESKASIVTFLLLLTGVCVYLYLSFFFTYLTSDDGYYIPRAAEVLANNSLAISDSAAWFGESIGGFPRTSDASTLEFFKAYLSYCSGIPVTILCRNALNIAFSVISLAAIFNLAGDLAGPRSNALRFQMLSVFFYCILIIIDSRSSASAAAWSLRYVWQGKAILCAIIFPMLASACTWIVRSENSPAEKCSWIFVAAALTAGISVAIVGAFLPFICYFTLGVPYMIVSGWKKARTMLLPAILSSLPVLLFSGLTYLDIISHNTHYFMDTAMLSWMEHCNILFASNRYMFLMLYVACLIYICIRGNRLTKLILVGQPIAMLLTFLNPLLFGLVSTYITTAMVYWRLWWILPIYFLPAFVFSDVAVKISADRFRCIAFTAVCVLAVQHGMNLAREGQPALLKNAYCKAMHVAPRTNQYVLDQTAVDAVDCILNDYKGLDNPRVIGSDGISFMFRQYSIDIHLACGVRPEQREYLVKPIAGTDVPQSEFYERLFSGEIKDAAYLYDMLTRLDVDYLIFPEGIIPEDTNVTGIRYLTGIREYKIWRVIK